MPTTSSKDLGAVQRKESGAPTANTSYVDLGASQRLVVPPNTWYYLATLTATRHGA